MIYRLLADTLVALHFAFVLFVGAGGLLVLRWPRLAWLHLPAALWGAGIALAGGICPLTPLEIRLRRVAGGQGYEGGFVEHYLLPVLYPGALTRELQVAIGLAVVVVNLAVYGTLWIRRRRRPVC